MDNVDRPLRCIYGCFIDLIPRVFETCSLNFSDSELSLVKDFSLKLLKHEPTIMFSVFSIKCMYTYAICPVIWRPTLVANLSATFLNKIWTNDPMFCYKRRIRTHITDQRTVFMT